MTKLRIAGPKQRGKTQPSQSKADADVPVSISEFDREGMGIAAKE